MCIRLCTQEQYIASTEFYHVHTQYKNFKSFTDKIICLIKYLLSIKMQIEMYVCLKIEKYSILFNFQKSTLKFSFIKAFKNINSPNYFGLFYRHYNRYLSIFINNIIYFSYFIYYERNVMYNFYNSLYLSKGILKGGSIGHETPLIYKKTYNSQL